MQERFLDQIHCPQDLQTRTPEELPIIAQEIRDTLIQTVSQTGGHLASNLGVVELTIAMHYCFDSPKDQFVWDVGHQVYTHKLLTGRTDQFSTLRQQDGLSGFGSPPESIHDPFYTGHAGTSISAALGLSSANVIQGRGNYTVAVVGDGSFTSGMVYEALNNAGRTNNNLIVVLNENEMSISENVGAVARYLAALRTKPAYYEFKARAERFLKHIPLIGERLAEGVSGVKSTVKNMLYQSTWFEELGFRYVGPIDGHDIPQLMEAFQSAKLMKRPVFLHINTVKGKGYDFAERAPERFHGIEKFDIDSGEPVPSQKTYSQCFGDKMCELAQRNMNICAITAAMTTPTGLSEFSQRYGGRFFDVGIAEEHAVTFASGLAKNGMTPVFAVYASFLQRCFDQLLHDGALQQQKIVLAVDRAGFVGGDGETHQGIYDVAMLNGIPHLEIYAPTSFLELERFLQDAVYGPVRVTAIRYPRGEEVSLPTDYSPAFGAYDIVGPQHASCAIVTYGRIFAEALAAQQELKKQGIAVRIVKLNRVKPIDPQAVTAVLPCAVVHFFEEGVQNGGAAQSFAALLLQQQYRGKYRIHAVGDAFVRQAPAALSLARFGLDCAGMVAAILAEDAVT